MTIDIGIVGGVLAIVLAFAAIFNWCFISPLRRSDKLQGAIETFSAELKHLNKNMIRFETILETDRKERHEQDKRIFGVEKEIETMWKRFDEIKAYIGMKEPGG